MRICSRCRRKYLPQRAKPSWHSDLHRSAAKGMVAPVDPRAEKVRRRKTKKRNPYMTRDTLGAVKLIIRAAVLEPQSNPDDAECADCQALNQKVA